jgi:hypothetical protein
MLELILSEKQAEWGMLITGVLLLNRWYSDNARMDNIEKSNRVGQDTH